MDHHHCIQPDTRRSQETAHVQNSRQGTQDKNYMAGAPCDSCLPIVLRPKESYREWGVPNGYNLLKDRPGR